MNEAPWENKEMVKLGRELLEKYIADELSGKEGTGHFLKGGGENKRELVENFSLDELEPDDFIMANKILVGIMPDEFWSYAKERLGKGNNSQQTLVAMLSNKVTLLEEKRGALPPKQT